MDCQELLDPFLGQSTAIKKLAELAHKVKDNDSSLLIQGETGAGKGALARWLHDNGPRASEPFVDLNCGSLNRELLESELFGHEKGAFTGAICDKIGLLEIAHKGTVLLDEIADMDPQVQPKLLKVVEEKQFRRLGGVQSKRVDIRLLAATHRDLGSLARNHGFRSDLFFRVSTIVLHAPPLRSRPEDIPAIAQRLLRSICSKLRVPTVDLSHIAIQALQSHQWPGNIRELKNVLYRAVLLKEDKVISNRDLQLDPQASGPAFRAASGKTLRQVEQEYIETVLALESGHVQSAARRLGIPRSTLYHKLKGYGFNFRRAGEASGQRICDQSEVAEALRAGKVV